MGSLIGHGLVQDGRRHGRGLDDSLHDTGLATVGAAVGGTVGILATGILDLGEHTPVIAPLCNALKRVKNYFEEKRRRWCRLMELHDRCTLLTTWVIIRYDEESSRLPITPLRDCVDELEKLVIKYAKLSAWRRWSWSFDGKDVDELGRRVDGIVIAMHFAVTVNSADHIRLMAERLLEDKKESGVSLRIRAVTKFHTHVSD